MKHSPIANTFMMGSKKAEDMTDYYNCPSVFSRRGQYIHKDVGGEPNKENIPPVDANKGDLKEKTNLSSKQTLEQIIPRCSSQVKEERRLMRQRRRLGGQSWMESCQGDQKEPTGDAGGLPPKMQSLGGQSNGQQSMCSKMEGIMKNFDPCRYESRSRLSEELKETGRGEVNRS